MLILKNLVGIWLGFGAGVVISGAVFAFIAIVGVVPRLTQKTGTGKYIKIYEEALIFGGIIGASTDFFDLYIPIGSIGVIIYSISVGMFFGCMAMSLAEVLDVMPILARRGRIQKGLPIFILSLALGKLAGSLLYFLVPGYYTP